MTVSAASRSPPPLSSLPALPPSRSATPSATSSLLDGPHDLTESSLFHLADRHPVAQPSTPSTILQDLADIVIPPPSRAEAGTQTPETTTTEVPSMASQDTVTSQDPTWGPMIRLATAQKELQAVVQRLPPSEADDGSWAPTVVILGDSTAAILSLLQGFTDLKLPFTKLEAVLEVRTAPSSEDWSCDIHLVSGDFDSASAAAGAPFASVKNVDDAAEALERAAKGAELQPNTDVSSEENQSVPGSGFVKRIVAHLRGPSFAEVTFRALPENQRDGGAEAVSTELTGASAIVVGISASASPITYNSATTAQSVDPYGERTIAVLAQTDTLERGTELQAIGSVQRQVHWLPKLYATALPRADSDTTPIQARCQEILQFASPRWWMHLPEMRARFGTQVVIGSLLSVLWDDLLSRVPPLKRRITSQRTAVGSRLKEVPEPLSRDPQFELLDLCNTLFIRLNNQYLGLPGREQLWRQTRKVYKDFKDEVEQAVPVFEVTTVTEDAPGHGPHTPSQATPADDPGGDLRGRRNITLHEVRVLIENSRTNELPLTTPYSAKTILTGIPLESWKAAAARVLERTVPLFAELLDSELNALFGRWTASGLLDDVRTIASDEVSKHASQCRGFVEQLLQIEDVPYTQDSDLFGRIRAKTLAKLRAELTEPEVSTQKVSPEGRRLTNRLEAVGCLAIQDTARAEEEMTVAAEVTAYLHIASRRIGDTVPMAVYHELLKPLPPAILQALMTRLEVANADRCAERLVEPPHVIAKRESLRSALAELDRIEDDLAHTACRSRR